MKQFHYSLTLAGAPNCVARAPAQSFPFLEEDKSQAQKLQSVRLLGTQGECFTLALHVMGLERWLGGLEYCCYSRGPSFNSQHPHHGPKPVVTPVLGAPSPPLLTSESTRNVTVHLHMCSKSTQTHNMKI